MSFKIINDELDVGMVDGIVLERAASSLMPIGNCKFIENQHSIRCRYELVMHTRYTDKNSEDGLYTSYKNMLLEAKNLGFKKLLLYPQNYSIEIVKKAITEFLEDNEMMIYMVSVTPKVDEPKPTNEELAKYIKLHYIEEKPRVYIPPLYNQKPIPLPQTPMVQACIMPSGLSNALDQMEESFSEMLLRRIDESGMSDAECYKKANIDRKLFSKIRGDRFYRPSKITVLSFAIALELSLDDTNNMLRSAGYALSHSNKFDVIIEFFIKQGNYDIYEINEALFEYNQTLLGV